MQRIHISLSGGVSKKTWDAMSRQEKKQYVTEHPTSKYADKFRDEVIADPKASALSILDEDHLQGNPEIVSDAKYFKDFGKKVQKLVAKYAEHSTGDKHTASYGSGPSPIFGGSIEYADKFDKKVYMHGGVDVLRVDRLHHAVKLGSGFPKEKAKQFAKELVKLVNKHLQTEVSVKTADGVAKRKTKMVVNYGSAFTSIGVQLLK